MINNFLFIGAQLLPYQIFMAPSIMDCIESQVCLQFDLFTYNLCKLKQYDLLAYSS